MTPPRIALTDRERLVIEQLALGLSEPKVALRLGLSQGMVRGAIWRAKTANGCRTKGELLYRYGYWSHRQEWALAGAVVPA